jgi:hypothetical protein
VNTSDRFETGGLRKHLRFFFIQRHSDCRRNDYLDPTLYHELF